MELYADIEPTIVMENDTETTYDVVVGLYIDNHSTENCLYNHSYRICEPGTTTSALILYRKYPTSLTDLTVVPAVKVSGMTEPIPLDTLCKKIGRFRLSDYPASYDSDDPPHRYIIVDTDMLGWEDVYHAGTAPKALKRANTVVNLGRL